VESQLLINVIGTGAALCTITSFVPQIIKIIRERDASSVSLRMYGLTVSAFSLWTIYGVMLGAWPLVAANSVSLMLAATALVCKWRFRDGDPEE
jgi:MtN3 and saliva related transmembrane protein